MTIRPRKGVVRDDEMEGVTYRVKKKPLYTMLERQGILIKLKCMLTMFLSFFSKISFKYLSYRNIINALAEHGTLYGTRIAKYMLHFATSKR